MISFTIKMKNNHYFWAKKYDWKIVVNNDFIAQNILFWNQDFLKTLKIIILNNE